MALPLRCSRFFRALKDVSFSPANVSHSSPSSMFLAFQSFAFRRSFHLNNSSWVSSLPKSRTTPRVRFGAEQQRQLFFRRFNSQESKINEQQQESAQKAKHMKYVFIGSGVMFAVGGLFAICQYGAPQRDEDGNLIKDEYSDYSLIPQYLSRFYKEAIAFKKTIEEPSRPVLLPDTLPAPYIQPPYTLCLEVTGLLVHPEWSYQTGWRFKKRPGVSFFLQQVGPPLFEVVIYTKENGHTAYPIINSLDPQGYVMYRLFKDSTRYQDGHHIKDLDSLNRPINRVIHVDWDKEAVKLTPNNALTLKKWEGEMEDRTLIDLAIFLRTIAESGVDDVRGVLEYYSKFDDPLAAFRENQRRLAEQEVIAQEAERAKQTPAWRAFRARNLI